MLTHLNKVASTTPIAVIYRYLGFTFSTFTWHWQETLVHVIASKNSWELYIVAC